MSSRAELLAQRTDWMRQGTQRFQRELDALKDADFGAPSALEGWSRSHVVAHVVGNARALVNLMTWARTGVETRMYADAAQRAAEIESGATLAPERLRLEFEQSRLELDDAFAAMPGEAWGAEVITAQGRKVEATFVPWMRSREVWVHAVDIGPTASFEEFPSAFVEALIDESSTMFSGRDDCPSVTIEYDGRRRQLGAAGGPTVTGPPSAVLAWLLGRSRDGLATADGPTAIPQLPRWL
ncbi:MAG: hypothetical protein JWL73_1981 [Actinomycetia bacterium]|nr:hypothetical protein [Actinomycetes bacterium]